MYRVTEAFADCADNLHIYQPGDSFPRAGLSVSEERLNELMNDRNRSGHPLIQSVAQKKVTRKKG